MREQYCIHTIEKIRSRTVIRIAKVERNVAFSRLLIDSCVPAFRSLVKYIAWAVGDYCVSVKMLKSSHKRIYSFKLTMLWLSLFSSLSFPKYFNQYVQPRLRPRRHLAVILRISRHSVELMQDGA